MSKRGPKTPVKATIPLRQSWDAPAHLGPIARAEFDRVADLLRQRGTLDRTDSELVVRRAELVEVAVTAYQRRRKDGDYVESDRGNLAPHPAIRAHVSACGMIRLIDIELGLTPTRSKAAGGQAGQDGGYGRWAKHLGGGGS